jgi:hypothetical protein
MRYLIFFTVFSFVSLSLFGTDSTQQFLNDDENAFWSGDIARDFTPIVNEKRDIISISQQRNWSLIDSISLKEYIPAMYPTGFYYDIFFDSDSGMLNSFTTDFTYLTDSAEQAVQKSPQWMRPQLIHKMKTLYDEKQDFWANVILNAPDPYVDEIAFAIATLSPNYLISTLAEPEVLLTNAIYIYLNDMFLDYAEVVDYGTSATDENYYTTVRYMKMNEFGELEQVEIPKEIYYWYIAHPNITDEIPAFIDPTILEYNHQSNIVEPNEGYFWRDHISMSQCTETGAYRLPWT